MIHCIGYYHIADDVNVFHTCMCFGEHIHVMYLFSVEKIHYMKIYGWNCSFLDSSDLERYEDDFKTKFNYEISSDLHWQFGVSIFNGLPCYGSIFIVLAVMTTTVSFGKFPNRHPWTNHQRWRMQRNVCLLRGLLHLHCDITIDIKTKWKCDEIYAGYIRIA